VGRITLVDHDTVDLTNLQRQIAHDLLARGPAQGRIGRERRCRHQPRRAVCVPWCSRADDRPAGRAGARGRRGAGLLRQLPHPPRRQRRLRAPPRAAGVSGAAIGFDGQISVYDTRQPDAPCYACLFPPEATFEDVACATMGVFAPLVGIIGSVQAAEALKLLAGTGSSWPAGC
jgi:hypothetical protein